MSYTPFLWGNTWPKMYTHQYSWPHGPCILTSTFTTFSSCRSWFWHNLTSFRNVYSPKKVTQGPDRVVAWGQNMHLEVTLWGQFGSQPLFYTPNSKHLKIRANNYFFTFCQICNPNKGGNPCNLKRAVFPRKMRSFWTQKSLFYEGFSKITILDTLETQNWTLGNAHKTGGFIWPHLDP